jgi:tetratricopeptide (TPR) repeat protein
MLLDLKKYNEAEKAYRRDLEIEPQWGQTWMEFGNVLRAQSKYDEAEKAYRESLIRIGPADRYFTFADFLRELKRNDEADEVEKAGREFQSELNAGRK